jgi:hypothetical protein
MSPLSSYATATEFITLHAIQHACPPSPEPIRPILELLARASMLLCCTSHTIHFCFLIPSHPCVLKSQTCSSLHANLHAHCLRVYGMLTGQEMHEIRRLHFPGSQPVSLARANLGLLQMQRWGSGTVCSPQLKKGILRPVPYHGISWHLSWHVTWSPLPLGLLCHSIHLAIRTYLSGSLHR